MCYTAPMNTLIIVPAKLVPEGRRTTWHLANATGQTVTHRGEDWVRLENDDRLRVVVYPPDKRGQDVKGTAVDVLYVHLDLVCRWDYREIELVLLATLTGAKTLRNTRRIGDYKVYFVGAV